MKYVRYFRSGTDENLEKLHSNTKILNAFLTPPSALYFTYIAFPFMSVTWCGGNPTAKIGIKIVHDQIMLVNVSTVAIIVSLNPIIEISFYTKGCSLYADVSIQLHRGLVSALQDNMHR